MSQINGAVIETYVTTNATDMTRNCMDEKSTNLRCVTTRIFRNECIKTTVNYFI